MLLFWIDRFLQIHFSPVLVVYLAIFYESICYRTKIKEEKKKESRP